MPKFSYVQTDFRGGIWSMSAQGRMDVPIYKTALNECLNSLPQEDGSWTRRPGFRYIAHSKGGQTGRLVPFRFSRSQAYQAELTPLCLRFVIGLTLLRDEPEEPIISSISTGTPAVVYVNDLPWADGDTVMFNITSDPPQSYTLYGRQFVIQNVNLVTNSFELYDPVTGDPVDGTEIDWHNFGQADTVQRVLEYATPYTAADIPFVRIIQDAKDTVLFLCPGKPPYALVVSGATQFTFGEADFQDGPYFDENELVTTLTLSALTGSVTVTASGTAGINEGDGFKSTDVGRLIWFQGGPLAWNVATVYAKNAKVLGTDGNIYKSLIANNLANDPTTDAGTKWEITADVVSVTWLEITAFTDTTHVTALIRGANTTSGAATIHWRMGVFSYTTGFPTCGAYHEGRLVLAGAVPNRFDMSMNFKGLTFSPTEIDGTVSDDNAVAGTLNNKDAELISAMLSVDEGLFIATLSGEWMLKASALDDPISPTSAQARNPATTGAANIEVLHIYGMPTYVQSRQRKMITHRRVEGKFEGVNHNKFAQGLTSPRIVETAWCQEPMISFFCRLSDGKLIGATHKVSQLDESFTGWHRHEHGMERTFEALSAGPNFSGTSDSVFVITAHPTDPDAPRWIETMMPTQSEGDPAWVAWHTDGSGTGHYIRRMISADGDSYDGIKVYGLWHLNGETVHPFIGGLDLGNFLVTSGSIDLPYAGTFTEAFLAALNDGTDYSDWGIQLRWADAPVTTNPLHPLNTILVLDNTITPTPSGNQVLWDRDAEVYYRMGVNASTNIRVFDALSGDLLREAVSAIAIFPSDPTRNIEPVSANGPVWTYVRPDENFPDGSLFGLSKFIGAPATFDLSLINSTTLTEVGQMTFTDASHIPKNVQSIPYFQVDLLTGLPVYSQIGLISFQASDGRVLVVSLTNGGGLQAPLFTSLLETLTGSYNTMHYCRGWEDDGISVWYSYAPNGNTTPLQFDGAESFDIYEWTLTGTYPVHNVSNRLIATITPAALSLPGTEFGTVTVSFDANDGNLVFIGDDILETEWRVVKLRPTDGSVVWNSVAPDRIKNPPEQGYGNGPWRYDRWGFMAEGFLGPAGTIYTVNLKDGTWTTLQGQALGFTGLLGEDSAYDDFGPSLIVHAAFDASVGTPAPSVTYLGTWATAEAPSWALNIDRIWHGTSYTQDQEHREINAEYYFNPTNFGVSFTSRGQLLRPDFGQDAGAAAGPAFGKTRRNQEWAAAFVKSFNVKIGTDFSKLYPIKFKTLGGTLLTAPTLFSGVIADTLADDYSYEGKLAWEVTRQYPCTITAIGGFISTQDK